MVILRMAVSVQIALDKLLKARKMTRYELSKRIGTAYPTLDSYYKNKVTRYDSKMILKICLALQCEPGDIIRLVDDQEDA